MHFQHSKLAEVKDEEPDSEEKDASNGFSEKELFAKVKAEQVEIIKGFDDSLAIPNLEKDRVALILKLQEGSN